MCLEHNFGRIKKDSVGLGDSSQCLALKNMSLWELPTMKNTESVEFLNIIMFL